MKAKLAKKRQEGRGGWQSMASEQLSALLHEHVHKGDPVDVANLAMMLHQNGQRIEQQRAPDVAEPKSPTPKESWWAGYRAGKGLPANTPRQDAIAAPDVEGLVEALEYISKKSQDALKMTDNRARRIETQHRAPFTSFS